MSLREKPKKSEKKMYGHTNRKPAQSVKKAEELIKYGKLGSALDVLSEVLQNKKFRTWQPAVDSVIEKYLEICMISLNSQAVKSGFSNYRQIVQYSNISVMESTYMKFIYHLESLVDSCKEHLPVQNDRESFSDCAMRNYISSTGASSFIVESSAKEVVCNDAPNLQSSINSSSDLYSGKTTEEMDSNRMNIINDILSKSHDAQSLKEYVQYSKQHDHVVDASEKLKFAWECFRIILDLCRNNRNAEKIYYQVFLKACNFCKVYNGISEMEELSRMFQNHTTTLSLGLVNHNYCIELSDDRTMMYQCDMRLKHLEILLQLGIYTHAFKAIYQTYQIFAMFTSIPKIKIIVTFFKLFSVFLVKTKLFTYHALSLFCLFDLHKAHKSDVTFGELSLFVSKAVLSILALPSFSDKKRNWYEDFRGENLKKFTCFMEIFKLIYFVSKDEILRSRAIIIDVFTNKFVYKLYAIFQSEKIGLDFCKKVDLILADISKEFSTSNEFSIEQADLNSYFTQIKLNAFRRLLERISEAYECISLDRLCKFVPFYDINEIKRVILSEDFTFKVLLNDDSLVFERERAILSMKLFSTLNNDIESIIDPSYESDRKKKVRAIYQQLVENSDTLLENERKRRKYLNEVALNGIDDKEQARKKRDILVMRKREENRRLADEKNKIIRERELVQQNHEMIGKVLEIENQKIKDKKEKELMNFNQQKAQALKDLKQEDMVKKKQDQKIAETRRIEKHVMNLTRSVRLNEISKVEEFCQRFSINFDKMFNEEFEFQKRKHAESSQHRIQVKNHLVCYSNDIHDFINQCNKKPAEEARLARIEQRKRDEVQKLKEEHERKAPVSRSATKNYFDDKDIKQQPPRNQTNKFLSKGGFLANQIRNSSLHSGFKRV